MLTTDSITEQCSQLTKENPAKHTHAPARKFSIPNLISARLFKEIPLSENSLCFSSGKSM